MLHTEQTFDTLNSSIIEDCTMQSSDCISMLQKNELFELSLEDYLVQHPRRPRSKLATPQNKTISSWSFLPTVRKRQKEDEKFHFQALFVKTVTTLYLLFYRIVCMDFNTTCTHFTLFIYELFKLCSFMGDLIMQNIYIKQIM